VTSVLALLADELDRLASSPRGRNIALPFSDADADLPPLQLGEKHKLLRLRLALIKTLQSDLEKKLGASSIEPDYTLDDISDSPHSAAAALSVRPRRPSAEYAEDDAAGMTSHSYAARMPQADFFIRGSNGWKTALDKIGGRKHRDSISTPDKERDDATEMLVTCRDDIKSLWEDKVIQELLKRRNLRMEDAPGL
jgi:guanine nucleotide-binding protein alpha-1 subunit